MPVPSIQIRRAQHGSYRLECDLWLPRPIEAVFEFFADASNLEAITPPWLRFRILTPMPVSMAAGTRLSYRLQLHGIPLSWESEISGWDPPHRFVDEQRRGPYRFWVHEHRFVEEDGGTRVQDRVDYSILGGAIAHWLLVGRDLRRVFSYRSQKISELLGAASGTGSDGLE